MAVDGPGDSFMEYTREWITKVNRRGLLYGAYEKKWLFGDTPSATMVYTWRLANFKCLIASQTMGNNISAAAFEVAYCAYGNLTGTIRPLAISTKMCFASWSDWSWRCHLIAVGPLFFNALYCSFQNKFWKLSSLRLSDYYNSKFVLDRQLFHV